MVSHQIAGAEVLLILFKIGDNFLTGQETS
jgi:hypothetical protein